MDWMVEKESDHNWGSKATVNVPSMTVEHVCTKHSTRQFQNQTSAECSTLQRMTSTWNTCYEGTIHVFRFKKWGVNARKDSRRSNGQTYDGKDPRTVGCQRQEGQSTEQLPTRGGGLGERRTTQQRECTFMWEVIAKPYTYMHAKMVSNKQQRASTSFMSRTWDMRWTLNLQRHVCRSL